MFGVSPIATVSVPSEDRRRRRRNRTCCDFVELLTGVDEEALAFGDFHHCRRPKASNT